MKTVVNEKVEHVRAATQMRSHTCHWPGCGKQVPPARWGCKPHWLQLPFSIRNQIWATYRIGQEERMDPSPAYLTAALVADEWIKMKLRAKP